jgi:hypothetical protein
MLILPESRPVDLNSIAYRSAREVASRLPAQAVEICTESKQPQLGSEQKILAFFTTESQSHRENQQSLKAQGF